MTKPLTFKTYGRVGGLISDLPVRDVYISRIVWLKPARERSLKPFNFYAKPHDKFAFAFVRDLDGEIIESCLEAYKALQLYGNFITDGYRISLSLNEKFINRTLARNLKNPHLGEEEKK